ncbi:MAG: DUF4124 domain-containing protein [Xanthomonadales bacterium]|nr:DUF4124 domain-containing protein [Xanthomonadales bacterium]
MHTSLVRAIVALAATGILAAPVLAQGTRYKWRDAEGNLHYSDALPPDAGKRGYEVINAQGIVIKRVEAPKTPEQVAAAKAIAAKEQAARADAEARLRKDQQLLAAYPNEEELARAHQQQLEMLQQNIRSAEIGLQSQERNLAEQLGQAADIEREGKPVPQRIADLIGVTRAQIEAQHRVVDRRIAELEKAKLDFAAELEHYRALSR